MHWVRSFQSPPWWFRYHGYSSLTWLGGFGPSSESSTGWCHIGLFVFFEMCTFGSPNPRTPAIVPK